MALRFSTRLLFVAAIFTFAITDTSNAQVPPCGTILDSYKSIAVRSNGGAAFEGCAGYGPDPVNGIIYGLQYQCVEYVRRFYDAPDRLDPSYQTALYKWPRMNAIDFYSSYMNLGLEMFMNGKSQAAPQPNGIIVFDRVPGNDFGHVAIVRQGTDDNDIQIVEQNFAAGDGGRLLLAFDPISKNYTLGEHVSVYNNHYPVLAWLRAIPKPPPSTAFAIGDRIQVSIGDGPDLNVRSTPGGDIVGQQADSSLGTVIGGPVFVNGRWWWQIDYDDGPDGWSAEGFLKTTSPPEPNLVLYDDFNAAEIDSSKWDTLEFVREIRGGELTSKIRSSGPFRTDFLTLRSPAGVTSIQADVTVQDQAIAIFSAVSHNQARLFEKIYNDSSSITPGVGDIVAQISIAQAFSPTPFVQLALLRCEDTSCGAAQQIFVTLFPGIVPVPGQTFALSIQWDGALLTASVNDQVLVINPAPFAPIAQPAPDIPLVSIGTSASAAGSHIEATFDNVVVNGMLLDDFSGAQLDPSTWERDEFVREIDAGELRLRLNTRGGTTSNSGLPHSRIIACSLQTPAQ